MSNGRTTSRAHIVETTRYEIADAHGKVVAVHIRQDLEDGDKRMFWGRPDGRKGLGGLRVADLPLYGLPRLLTDDSAAPVVLTEGEAKADILQRLVGDQAVVVATVTGASSTPSDETLRPLVGRHVYPWADHDAEGRSHMGRIAEALVRLGSAPPRMIEWPGASRKGDDAADFVKLGGTVEELWELLEAAPPWDPGQKADDHPQRTATGVAGYTPASPGVGSHPTDLGNARRLVVQHGLDLRYVPQWGWRVWDGTRWTKDETGEIMRRAKQTVLTIYGEVASCGDPDVRKELAKWGAKSEAEQRLQAMVELAKTEPEIAATPEQFDIDPWLLNVRNGTLDLCTGVLGAHSREDLITKLVPADYDPNASCPTWDAFLDRIMESNASLIEFLQCAVGYALTGSTREQVLFILHGTGANGKTTFLVTLLAFLADYAAQTPTETLLIKKSGSIPNDVARLHGARLVSAVEVEGGKRLAEALVKQLTGGDIVTARFMFKEFFDFQPCFKLFLATNHKPEIRGTDNAIWRRIRLIPFNVTIPPQEQDKSLVEKLKAELPGILAWAVRGCLEWQRDGLGTPEEVAKATDGYRAEMDTLAAFLDECCYLAPNAKGTAKALYAVYTVWCQGSGEEALSQKKFGSALGERGFSRKRDGPGGTYQWHGVGLLNQLNHSEPISKYPHDGPSSIAGYGKTVQDGSVGSVEASDPESHAREDWP